MIIKPKKDICQIVAYAIALFCLLIFPHYVFSSSTGDSQDKLIKKIDLAGIRKVAARYDIAITDWQHHSYSIYFDKGKVFDQQSALKWLKTNLHNWAVNEDSLTGKSFFYLFPNGIKAQIFKLEKPKLKMFLTLEEIEELNKLRSSAKGLKIKDIFEQAELATLVRLAQSEKEQKLFYFRSVKEENATSEYSFSIVYNAREDKFKPFELNGSRVSSNTLEGFVCYETVLRYLKTNSSKLEVRNTDNWVFLSPKDNPSSFVALREIGKGLNIIVLSKAGNQSTIQYEILQTDYGFYSSTRIPTKGTEVVLTDMVSYY